MFYLSLTVLGVLIWALLEPYMVDRQEHTAALPFLPAHYEGKSFAVLADLQVGKWWSNTFTVRRMVRQIIKEQPAFVLVAGDFIYDTSHGIVVATRLLKPLTQAAIPVYAVLGNHDYAMPYDTDPRDLELASALTGALENIGVRVLDNEMVMLGEEDEPLHLVGLGCDDGLNAAALLSALPERASRLVLMHHPEMFVALPAGSAPLAVAGHTHGGQVRFPILPSLYRPLLHRLHFLLDGWVEGYGQIGNRLYINRGVGFSVLPMRLGCPPELTFFKLERASQ